MTVTLDPQDPLFSSDKITKMINYFNESSDTGKLYLNYPMIEAYYHMTTIPDKDYFSRKVSFKELVEGTYKARVNSENRNHDYSKFAINKEECDLVIWQNIQKAFLLSEKKNFSRDELPNNEKILEAQLNELFCTNELFVLCTCVFFIPEYNPKLISTLPN